MDEQWKDVVGYEGLYQVSSQLRVKRVAGGQGAVPGRILKVQKHRNGYLSVILYRDRKQTRESLHRLAATAFLGPPPSPDYQVNHRNGVRDDRHVENLEWVTAAENTRHAIEVLGKATRGEAHGGAKNTREDVLEIRRLAATGELTQAELGKMFGVGQAAISKIVRRVTWRHVA